MPGTSDRRSVNTGSMWLQCVLGRSHMRSDSMQVGVRELRDHLSRYLDRVRQGEEVVVTDRGRAVARLLPMGFESALDRLVSDGLVTPAPQPRDDSQRPIRTKGTVSDLIADQRR